MPLAPRSWAVARASGSPEPAVASETPPGAAADAPAARAARIARALDRFEAPLVRYAARFTGDLGRARDVVQDAFLRLCVADPAPPDERLAAWLYAVCRHRALDVRRKEARMTPLAEPHLDLRPAPRPGPAENALHSDEHARVARLVATLPESQQEVLRRKFQDGLSYREIADVTGHSVSHVGVLLHHGLRRLRALMEGP